MAIFSRSACLVGGWSKDVRIEVGNGRISSITPGATAQPGDVTVDALLPASANLHSHAFQRAMAGMTERRAVGRDSFWTWRTRMYGFLDHLAPEHVEAIAALAYMEMLEAGFASVGEFHYLHHRPGGEPYATLGEMTQRIFSAAVRSGIGLTYLPVLYTYGGAGQKPVEGGQLRFVNDVDRFNRLVSEARANIAGVGTDARVGIAPHSLRATCPEDLETVLAAQGDGPVHIHVAEQPAEVADISRWLGARPAAWLLDNLAVDARWCLVHATHMTGAETAALARSGAVAGLCPITEANLGDGLFNGAVYIDHRGAFGVGTDSNVRISLAEELRLLEYSQRLRDLNRNVLALGSGSVGAFIYLGAAAGGAQALGRDSGTIRVGAVADLVAVDRGSAALCALPDEQVLDGFCFAGGSEVVTDVWSAGRHMVRQGRHVERDRILADYRAAMARLAEEI